ncbi:MAG TPA: ABC transporter permease [Iamia sp.]|nr:ABC transporter permease [Iamia sp.]
MSGVRPLALAMWKGFIRDRMTLFFTILFPLMFLFLFGAIFADPAQPRSEIDVVGRSDLIDSLPDDARAAFDDAFDVTRTDDRDEAIRRVREGDADAALEQDGDRLVVHFSRADPTKAAVVQGTLRGFVDAANIAAAGVEPRYALDARQVEDSSLTGIQFVAPGLVGWAVATSATFGAALTLVTWRQSELLRRIRMTPVPTASVVSARVMVTMIVALAQLAIFIGLAALVFDLQLTGSWYMAVPLVMAGTLTFMAIGLLCGSVARTSEGASGLANLIVLPMAFLSGSFIPLDIGPDWLRTVSHAFPLRYLNEGMLDVMVRGQGPDAVLAPIAVLLGAAAVITAIATRWFRWDKA